MAEITNNAEYEWAVARVERILAELDGRGETTQVLNAPSLSYGMPKESRAKSLEIELKLLSELVADYSEKNYSIGSPTLAGVIGLRLAEMGMSRKELAEKIGVSQSRISEYMTGKSEPTLRIARELCRVLNIDPAIALGL